MRMMLRVNHYSIKYKHLFHTLTKIFSTAPPGLVAQVVPGSLSNLKLGSSIPRINNYLAKKKKNIKGRKRNTKNEKRITNVDTNLLVVSVV